MTSIELPTLVLAGLTAVASGLVGSFALMRRMTLAGDAFAHVALPGIGLALLFSINHVLGGALALLIGALIIWKTEKISGLNTEAVIGVLFSLSLALGALLFEEEQQLMEVLFGKSLQIGAQEFVLGLLASLLIIAFIVLRRKALVLSLVSRELAKSAGISVDSLRLQFLLVFAFTVILGMKFLGVLLMGALIIIPAAAARNLAGNLFSMLVGASLVALASSLAGIFLADTLQKPLGPVIIAIAGAIFAFSLILAKTKNY